MDRVSYRFLLERFETAPTNSLVLAQRGGAPKNKLPAILFCMLVKSYFRGKIEGMDKILLGLIREEKVPRDSRVALTPAQCREILDQGIFDIVVQSCAHRCYRDEEYKALGVPVLEDLGDCSVLIGIKEVPVEFILQDKVYFIFSHTIKKQSHNRKLLQRMLEYHNHLIDYEVVVDDKGERLIAFGHFAGMVGAHNAIWTFGQRTGQYAMRRMYEARDYAEMKAEYSNLKLPKMKVILTGDGRVSTGAVGVLEDMGLRRVSPDEFLKEEFDDAVFTQLTPMEYVKKLDGTEFKLEDYYNHPEAFRMECGPYLEAGDIFINGIYWDTRYPPFFEIKDMDKASFHVKVIADITCDIGPDASIPSTIKASTIADPIFGFDPKTVSETEPFAEGAITMMTIDNLPNELPRDASEAFGQKFMQYLLPEIPKRGNSPILQRATIAKNGQLGPRFGYLADFVEQEHHALSLDK